MRFRDQTMAATAGVVLMAGIVGFSVGRTRNRSGMVKVGESEVTSLSLPVPNNFILQQEVNELNGEHQQAVVLLHNDIETLRGQFEWQLQQQKMIHERDIVLLWRRVESEKAQFEEKGEPKAKPGRRLGSADELDEVDVTKATMLLLPIPTNAILQQEVSALNGQHQNSVVLLHNDIANLRTQFDWQLREMKIVHERDIVVLYKRIESLRAEREGAEKAAPEKAAPEKAAHGKPHA